MYTPDENIVAIATALGPSALAVLRTSGKECIECISRVFSRPNALKNAKTHSLIYGWIIQPTQNPDTKIEKPIKIDEVMLAVYRNPTSFTGEDSVEISCHGGTTSVQAIYRLLLQNGFRTAHEGEFSFRAFINGKRDLTQTEAIKEIIDSKTAEGASRACGRLSGNLYNELVTIKKGIIDAVGELEAEIEYPEDEHAISGVFNKHAIQQIRQQLITLSLSWQGEKLYQDGFRIVLAGQTNAGKSSLFNMLLKEERAIVSDVHGTTRDWIESWVSIGGIPARLFDTAGLRSSTDIVEKAGIERSFNLIQDADLLLYVIDSQQGLTQEDEALLEQLLLKLKKSNTEPIPLIFLWNKIDLNNQFKKTLKQSYPDFLLSTPQSEVFISAKTGEGLSTLFNTCKTMLSTSMATERTQAGLGSIRQKQAVDEALDCINHALGDEVTNLPFDALIQDFENALFALSEITGETVVDDVLESIFSRFCVGK